MKVPAIVRQVLRCLRLEAPEAVCADIETKIFAEFEKVPEVFPGLYRHSKTGNLYTVQSVGIYCGRHEVPEGHDPCWSKYQGFREGTELVVYIGHYNNPRGNRVYIRPLWEWNEGIEPSMEIGEPSGPVS